MEVIFYHPLATDKLCPRLRAGHYQRGGARFVNGCLRGVCTTLQTANMKLNLFVQSHLKVNQKLLESNIPAEYQITETDYPTAERLCWGRDATDTTINRKGIENERSALFFRSLFRFFSPPSSNTPPFLLLV